MNARLLKIIAVFTFGMVTFPFVLTNDVLAFWNIDPMRLLIYYSAFLITYALGYLFGTIAKRGRRERSRKLLLLLCRFIGCCTFFLSLLMLYFTENIAIIFAAGLSAAFWYFLGERAVQKHYADIFPMAMFGVYIAVALLSYFFYGALAEEALLAPVQQAVIAAFMLELCLTALLINQSAIYDKASRRKETKAILPKGLSGYNAALILFITAAGMGLFVFADKIVFVLKEILKLLLTVFLWLIRVPVDPMETEPVDLDSVEASKGSDIFGWEPLLYLTAIAMIIIFRKQIWRFIKNTVRSIIAFFMREQEKSGEVPDFVDYTEQAAPRRKPRAERLSDSALRRRYRAETSAREKFRLGYRLLLRNMQGRGVKLSPADTCGQQCGKGEKVLGDKLPLIEEGYNTVRYSGDEPAAEASAAMDELLTVRQ